MLILGIALNLDKCQTDLLVARTDCASVKASERSEIPGRTERSSPDHLQFLHLATAAAAAILLPPAASTSRSRSPILSYIFVH